MEQIRVRVTVVVEHQGKILLIQERSGQELQYSLPGGGIEYQEKIPDAVQREVWEETGLLVQFRRLLWLDERIHLEEGKHTIGVGVLAELIGEDTTPMAGGIEGENITWAGWVDMDEFRKWPLDNLHRRDQVIKALTDKHYLAEYIGNVFSNFLDDDPDK
ncbi:NUDIX domain-containing protein [Brevibacillus sp. SYSU BS000544]|uniref:NUDIX domain-containing protein n=1 Tax=Brevibacillus sp. SYSU BS000544 TaxID=3416443 RepID=UPI003CE5B874